ncbi:MAG: SAM-dependent methyltransferase [Rubrivivax sp.]|jgi:16S rRNA (cytidine1402-2'-O)-methyltransferase
MTTPPFPAGDSRWPAGLYLVPNTLDLAAEPVDIREVLPEGVLRLAATLRHWVAEDARSTRAFLKRVAAVHPLACALQDIAIAELPRPRKGRSAGVEPGAWLALLEPAFDGHPLGLISEAGLPAVADPGARLVAAAHQAGIPVRPLPGPSSLLLALAASGLDGQHFAFVGYLPQDAPARVARIRELEATSRRLHQTQVLIETPYRNPAMLQALLDTLAPGTRLAVSIGLTLPEGCSRTDTVAGWRARPMALNPRLPAVYCLAG